MEEFDQEQSGSEQLGDIDEEAADLDTEPDELSDDEPAPEGESEGADDV
jgi:hypothetical protein